MLRLWLKFDDDSFADFSWAVASDDSTSSIEWQAASEDELAEIVSRNPLPAIIVVPQQYVYLNLVELPEKASRQVIAAIEYQVEDRLAADVDGQHVAIGNIAENPLAIAVVTRALMQRCIALVEARGIRVTRILPEIFLCPWDGEAATLMRQDDGWLLRYGRFLGIKAADAALGTLFGLIRQSAGIERLRVIGDSGPPLQLEDIKIESVSDGTTLAEILDGPLIDLQQRDFQSSSAWISLGKAWKWIVLLVALLVVVGGYNRAIALQELETELFDIRERQFQLLQPYLPLDTPVDANLKTLLIERLQAARANQRERDFLALLDEFTRARGAHPDIEITRIVFQGDRLGLDISSAQLANMEALLAAIRARGIEARMENLSIKPERSSGRLLMIGGSDEDG